MAGQIAWIVMLGSLTVASATAARAVVFDSSAGTPFDERQVLPVWLGFRPADGQVCEVNPPRFSWPYRPGILSEREDWLQQKPAARTHTYTLQIASDAGLNDLALDESNLDINFFNALPVLEGSSTWYWRVGYDVGTPHETWSRVRSFRLARDAVEWDRTIIRRIGDYLKPHPRLIFNSENTGKLLAAAETNAQCREIRDRIVAAGDKYLASRWHKKLPDSDRPGCGVTISQFGGIGTQLEQVAWAYTLTGDGKYVAATEDALRIASYPAGGLSQPEIPGSGEKWATGLTRGLGIFLDRFWHELAPHEREAIIRSVEWRIDQNLNQFTWRKKNAAVSEAGLAMVARSHPFEASMWTLPGALAIYEHSAVAREYVHIVLNFLAGVTNPFGPEEAWNEGAGYGNWKFRTMFEATLLCHLTVPELHLERNPYYNRIGNFLCRLTPVGLPRSSFGNQPPRGTAYGGVHGMLFRCLACLTGNGQFLANYEACCDFIGGVPGGVHLASEYALLAQGPAPKASPERRHSHLFNIAGWVTTNSQPPSDFKAWKQAVGMTFHCRPRGGYSHSFDSENAFDLFAYGQLLAVGGATALNTERLQHRTWSHNTVLIDGLGQRQDINNADHPWMGRICAFREADGVVYWCGDATWAYRPVPHLRHFLRHVLFVDNKYFIIFDDLATDRGHDPSTFTWLYHFLPELPVQWDAGGGEFSYTMEDVHVLVKHIAGPDDLGFENRRGPRDGTVNPITGEDMHNNVAGALKLKRGAWERNFTNTNIWISTKTPSHERTFLAVIVPWKAGDAEPTVERISHAEVRVTWPGTKPRTIAFGRPGQVSGDIIVDYADVRAKCSSDAIRAQIELPRNVTLPDGQGDA